MPDKKHLVTDFFNVTRDEVGPVAGQKNREGFGFFFSSTSISDSSEFFKVYKYP